MSSIHTHAKLAKVEAKSLTTNDRSALALFHARWLHCNFSKYGGMLSSLRPASGFFRHQNLTAFFRSTGPAGPSGGNLEPEAVDQRPGVAGIIHRRNWRLMAPSFRSAPNRRWPVPAHLRTAVVGALVTLATIGASGCSRRYRVSTIDSTSSARQVLRPLWQKSLGPQQFLAYKPQEFGSATIGPHGTIYVGSTARRLVAIGRTGVRRWYVRTEGAVSSQALVVPPTETVYFGADDGKLYAVNARTGAVRWTYQTQGVVRHAPAYADGVLLFTTNEDRIYAVDAGTGAWRWQYDREPPEGFTIHGFAGPTLLGGLVYTGFSDGTVVALKPATGEVAWTRRLAGETEPYVDVDATPAVAGNLLITTSYATGVYALEPESGTVVWHFALPGANAVSTSATRVFATAYQAGLVALNHRGEMLWSQAIRHGVTSKPLVMGPYVLTSSSEEGLFVAAASSGALMQYVNPGHGISGPPATRGDLVVFLSNRGILYAMETL